MARGKPFSVLPMEDALDTSLIAVARYDGDPDVFTALAWAHCITEDVAWSIEPPEPRLYRINPDPTREYPWLLAEATRRGPGTWLGATVRVGRYFEPEWARLMRERPIFEETCEAQHFRPTDLGGELVNLAAWTQDKEMSDAWA